MSCQNIAKQVEAKREGNKNKQNYHFYQIKTWNCDFLGKNYESNEIDREIS